MSVYIDPKLTSLMSGKTHLLICQNPLFVNWQKKRWTHNGVCVMVCDPNPFDHTDLQVSGKIYPDQPVSIKTIFVSGRRLCVLYTIDSVYHLTTCTSVSGFGEIFSTGIKSDHYPVQVIDHAGNSHIVLFKKDKTPVAFTYNGETFSRSYENVLPRSFNLDMKIERDGVEVGVFSYCIIAEDKIYFFHESNVYQLDLVRYEQGKSKSAILLPEKILVLQ